MKFEIASVDSIIIYFGDIISEEIAQIVQISYEKIISKNFSFIKNLTPSYTSILVEFDLALISHETITKKLHNLLNKSSATHINSNQSVICIPTLYDTKVGIDLEDIAKEHNLTTDEVIQIHSQKEYLVYAIGFLPGFAYMGEVDKRIATPRIANPRTKVPKGSVSIANLQCAIYPKQSPGGWRILGRTPIELFDLSLKSFSYLKTGDRVLFKPISKEEFIALGGLYE